MVRGIDHRLLLAAVLQDHEPKSGRVNTVLARGQQTMILADRPRDALSRELEELDPGECLFREGQDILEERRRIKTQAFEHQRLLQRKIAE